MLTKSLVSQRLTCAVYLLTLLYYTVQRKEIPKDYLDNQRYNFNTVLCHMSEIK